MPPTEVCSENQPLKCGSGRWFEDDPIALTLQSLDGTAACALARALIEVVNAELLVARAAHQDVIDNHQDGARHGHDCLSVAVVAHDTTVARRKSGIGGSGRCLRRFNEGGAKPAVPFAGLSGFVLPGTLIVPRTHPRPAREVAGGREHAHVDAELGDQYFGGALVDARDRVEVFHRLGERFDECRHLCAERIDQLVQVVNVRQEVTEQKGMMGPEPTDERLAKSGNLLAQRGLVKRCVNEDQAAALSLPRLARTPLT